jgi:hypothetical protein
MASTASSQAFTHKPTFGQLSPTHHRNTPSPNHEMVPAHCHPDYQVQGPLNPMVDHYNPGMSHHHPHHYYPESSRSYFNFYQYQHTYPEHQHHHQNQHQMSPPRDYSPESESSQLSPVPAAGQGLHTPGAHHDFHSHYYSFSQYSGCNQMDPSSTSSMILENPSQRLTSPSFAQPGASSPGLSRFGSSMADLNRPSGLMMINSEKRSSAPGSAGGGKLPTGSNKKERRRTQSINNAFASLRDCIPNVPCDTKLSKIKTLRLATSYIDYLMQMLNSENASSGKLFCFKLFVKKHFTFLIFTEKLVGRNYS